VGTKDARILHRTKIRSWNSRRVDPGRHALCPLKGRRGCWLRPCRCGTQRSTTIRRGPVAKITVDAVLRARCQGEGGVSFFDQCPLFVKQPEEKRLVLLDGAAEPHGHFRLISPQRGGARLIVRP